MPESARPLWKLIIACELLSREAARQLVETYSEAGLGLDATPADVARRLVADGHISRYHAHHLLRDQRRRFRYGAYLVWEPVENGRFKGLYRARRDDDAAFYLLHRGEKAETEAAEVGKQRERWRQLAGDDDGLYPIATEFVAAEHIIVIVDDIAGQTLAAAHDDQTITGAAAIGRAGRDMAVALSRLHKAGVSHGGLTPDNVWCSDDAQNDNQQLRLLGPPLVQLAASHNEQERQAAWDHDAGALADWLRHGLDSGGVHRPVLEEVIARLSGADGTERFSDAQEVAAALDVFGTDRHEASGKDEPDRKDEQSAAFPAIQVGDTSMSARVKTRTGADSARSRRAKPTERGDVSDNVSDNDSTTERHGTALGDRRARWPLLVGAVSTLLALVVVGWWLWRLISPAASLATNQPVGNATAPAADRANEDIAATANPTSSVPQPARQSEQWRSPTAGEPIDLAYLPSGVQAIVAVRAAELWRSPQGERIVETLGPWAQTLVDDVQRRCGVPLAEVEQLIVAFRDAGSTQPEMIVVVRLAESRQLDEWLAVWPHDSEVTIGDQTVYERGELRLWFPEPLSSDASHRLAVIASGDTLQEIIDSTGVPPAASRQFTALLQQSDADRQITILGMPSFLQSGARDLLGGEAVAVRELVDLWLRDEVAAYLLSFDIDEDFFSEIRVYPASGVKPDALARRLQAELIASPGELRDYVERLDLSDYGRRVVMRLPRMVEAWAEFLRYSIEDRQVVFRSYLPANAAHNLAIGGQIILLEEPNRTADVTVTAAELSVVERLDRTMSLIIPRESLHVSLEMLADNMGVAIEIVGGDLETEGITKNQAISVEVRDQSGRAILETILRSADKDGRLVFVVHEAEDQNDAGSDREAKIVVTTRAAAANRGDTIAGPAADEIE